MDPSYYKYTRPATAANLWAGGGDEDDDEEENFEYQGQAPADSPFQLRVGSEPPQQQYQPQYQQHPQPGAGFYHYQHQEVPLDQLSMNVAPRPIPQPPLYYQPAIAQQHQELYQQRVPVANGNGEFAVLDPYYPENQEQNQFHPRPEEVVRPQGPPPPPPVVPRPEVSRSMPRSMSSSDRPSKYSSTPNAAAWKHIRAANMGRAKSPQKELASILESTVQSEGSPMVAVTYHPVTGRFLCFRRHEMKEVNTADAIAASQTPAATPNGKKKTPSKKAAQYHPQEICCDVCSRVVEASVKGDAAVGTTPRRGKRAVSMSHNEKKRVASLTHLHCDECDSDVCGVCRLEIVANPRRHESCLRCADCGGFGLDTELHVCNVFTNELKTESSDVDEDPPVVEKKPRKVKEETPVKAAATPTRKVKEEIPIKAAATPSKGLKGRQKRERDDAVANVPVKKETKKRGAEKKGGPAKDLVPHIPALPPPEPPAPPTVGKHRVHLIEFPDNPKEEPTVTTIEPTLEDQTSKPPKPSSDKVIITLVVQGVPRFLKHSLLREYLTVVIKKTEMLTKEEQAKVKGEIVTLKIPMVRHDEFRRKFSMEFEDDEDADSFVDACHKRTLQGVRLNWCWLEHLR